MKVLHLKEQYSSPIELININSNHGWHYRSPLITLGIYQCKYIHLSEILVWPLQPMSGKREKYAKLKTLTCWSHRESLLHINVLELKAAFLATQSFLKYQANIVVKFRLDNTRAVSYINNQGGTCSPILTSQTLELWNWCLRHNILLKAEYLLGVQNVQCIQWLERLENTIGDYRTFSQGQGDRPLCLPIDQSTATLCQLAPGSPRLHNRRVYSGLEYQQHCSAEGFPSTVTRLLSSSTRRLTNKAYDSAWGKWHSWCHCRQIDPILASIRDILTFLSDQFDSRLQYHTINLLHSAISSVHPWVDSKPAG